MYDNLGIMFDNVGIMYDNLGIMYDNLSIMYGNLGIMYDNLGIMYDSLGITNDNLVFFWQDFSMIMIILEEQWSCCLMRLQHWRSLTRRVKFAPSSVNIMKALRRMAGHHLINSGGLEGCCQSIR